MISTMDLVNGLIGLGEDGTIEVRSDDEFNSSRDFLYGIGFIDKGETDISVYCFTNGNQEICLKKTYVPEPGQLRI